MIKYMFRYSPNAHLIFGLIVELIAIATRYRAEQCYINIFSYS